LPLLLFGAAGGSSASAQLCPARLSPDTVPRRGFIHRLDAEWRPQYVFPTNNFFKNNDEYLENSWDPIHHAKAFHLKYSFGFKPGTCADRIYAGAYQGLGLAFYNFGDRKRVGNPLLIYMFQGASIARLGSRVSFNYEWNFGLSTGWHPYNELTNRDNGVVGSKVNAYLNAGFYLRWALARHFDLTLGVDVTHFSNGNTKFPNAGVNTIGAKLGLAYNFNRTDEDLRPGTSSHPAHHFPKHFSYDLLFFGSWRRKGVYVEEDRQLPSPKAYPVAGFNFATMYNLGYKFRCGVSVDGVFDGSANVYAREPEDESPSLLHYDKTGYSPQADEGMDYDTSSPQQEFIRPSASKQLALGLSGRLEYVMPYFTINAGMGYNVLGKGDLRGWYQVLALKIAMPRNTFLHIGYNLQNFKTPNYLMLGLGIRLHDKSPKVRH
jgi:hypothetical protein